MITYRTPQRDDATALADLGRQSFVDAFGRFYRPEDLSSFLAETYTADGSYADIADPRRAIRLAEEEGALIGYCKLGFDRSLDGDAGDLRVAELKQLYLLGNRTGGGVGAALMDWAIGEARARECDAVILSVWSENHGGQRFYRRHGFDKWGDTVFMVGEQRDEEFIFGRKI